MSLKGYEWLDDNGEVVMNYLFKDLTINVIKDTTQEELKKFEDYLIKQGEPEGIFLNTNGHKISCN